LHVAPGDADGLALAIARILGDAALRARLGTGGRARVLERFTWRAAACATAELYDEVRAC
jgi:glycosyltransferase involved in cell wall biosynthesis